MSTDRERVERLMCEESEVIYTELCVEIGMLDDEEGHAGAARRIFKQSIRKCPIPDKDIAEWAEMSDDFIRAMFRIRFKPGLLRAFADLRPS